MLKLSAAVVLLSLVAQAGDYKTGVENYRNQRAVEIGGETGWAALTDLRWLENGQFTIGRGPENAIRLNAPSAPQRLGSLTVTPQTATFDVAPGVTARVNGKAVTTVQVPSNVAPVSGVSVGGMTFAVIERGDRRGLRVWDRVSPGRVNFRGLRWYPTDVRWRVDAQFIPHQPVPTMRIQNIVGQVVEMANPGAASFTVDGRTYQLEALLESTDANELFFMFKDGTSGKATYGAGRYLYTPLPRDGHVTLDFNVAINPPCAFTEFATCPLPPVKNRLLIPIEAGELDYLR
jgi:uncharacterized protein (DUF1684 family)